MMVVDRPGIRALTETKAHVSIGLMLATGFVVVAILYMLLIPRWLPYDEPSHFYYVAHIVGLPHFSVPAKIAHLDYEIRQQPPLAYLLYSPFLKAAVRLDVVSQLFVLRCVSIALGAATVYANVWIINALIGAHRLRSLLLATAGALVAFNPAFIAVSCTVTNDGLFDLLTALSIVVAILTVREVTSTRARWLLIGLGALLGLDASTKALALPLLLLPIVVVVVRFVWLNGGGKLLPWLMLALFIELLFGTLYYLSNLLIYNDPFGTSYTQPLMHSHRMHLSDASKIIPLSFVTFWFFVDYLRNSLVVRPSRWEGLPFLILSLAPLIAFGSIVIRRIIRPVLTRERVIVGSILILSLVSFVYKNIVDFGPEGRYLFGVIGPISWSIAEGIAYLALPSQRRRQWILRSVILFMIIYSLYAGLRYLSYAPNPYPNLYRYHESPQRMLSAHAREDWDMYHSHWYAGASAAHQPLRQGSSVLYGLTPARGPNRKVMGRKDLCLKSPRFAADGGSPIPAAVGMRQ